MNGSISFSILQQHPASFASSEFATPSNQLKDSITRKFRLLNCHDIRSIHTHLLATSESYATEQQLCICNRGYKL